MPIPALVDLAQVDFSRVNVYNHVFEDILSSIKKQFCSMNVTRQALGLGVQDSVTGWFQKLYSPSTIEMLILPKSAQSQALNLGYWVNMDALGFAIDPVNIYDLIVDSISRNWEIKTVQPHFVGDDFYFFVCDLKELPLYG